MKEKQEKKIKIILKPDYISWEELTILIRKAYAERKTQGLHFLATYQDVEQTIKRVGDGMCFIALYEEKLVGTVILKMNNAKGVFSQLAVSPKMKGQGIGNLLLEHVIKTAKQYNLNKLTCDTAIKAKDLINWYERKGFKKIGLLSYSTTNYYSVLLEKTIKGREKSSFQAKKQYLKSSTKTFLKLNKNGRTRKVWNLLPFRILKDIKWKLKFHKRENYEKKLIKNISGKKPIKIAFLLINESMWKYERIYKLFKEDPRFEPVVFICPLRTYGETIMLEELNNTYNSFVEKKYNVVNTYLENGNLLDIKKTFNPDIVFFSTPWNHSDPQFRIENFMNVLSCYVNYSYTTSILYDENYNRSTHNYCWKYFVESKFHQKMAKKHSLRKGKNTVVFGYPGTDNFIDEKYQPTEVWKKQTTKKKRIIWAPHHTIEGNISEKNLLNYSTFLRYADFMLEVVEKYKNQIQFAFKPHPNLRGKLNEHWGEEKTTNYYQKWDKGLNTQLEEGEYTDLFLTSDAMIHDCGSFLIEYLFTHKPVLYLINNETSKKQYNELGVKALENIPLGYSKKDIIDFIEKTILKGKDSHKEKRREFFETHLKPPNNKLASENIYEFLLKELF